MNERVKKLEQQVGTLVTDVAVIKATCATKEDIRALQSETGRAFAGLREEMHNSNASLRMEMHASNTSLRTEMYKAMESQTRWLFSAIFIALGAGLAVAKLIF